MLTAYTSAVNAIFTLEMPSNVKLFLHVCSPMVSLGWIYLQTSSLPQSSSLSFKESHVFFNYISARGWEQKSVITPWSRLLQQCKQKLCVSYFPSCTVTWLTHTLSWVLASLISFMHNCKDRPQSFHLHLIQSSGDDLGIICHIWKYCMILWPLRLLIGFSSYHYLFY